MVDDCLMISASNEIGDGGDDVSDDGGDDGGEDCDSEVCLSLDGGDLNYSSTEDIAGFQFSHNGCVTGAGGGDAAANGFTVSASGSAVLGFSFTGSVVPAGEELLLNFQVVFLKTVYQNLYSLMLMETHCLLGLEVALLMMVAMMVQMMELMTVAMMVVRIVIQRYDYLLMVP